MLGHPLGGKEVSIGPMRNINFPYVVLGRALLYQRMIEARTHACRDPLEIEAQPGQLQLTDPKARRHFEKLFAKLRKQVSYRADLVTSLAELVESQFTMQNVR